MRVLGVESAPFRVLPLAGSGEPAEDPAHARIERWLGAAIGNGVLRDGDRLPAEMDLAGAFEVSRMTLRQALGALESRGLVERRRGRNGGTFVRHPRIEIDLTGLAGFTEQMRRAQVRASARVVSANLLPAPPEVAAELRLTRRSKAYAIVRVRRANRVPIALEHTWLPAVVLPGLLEHRLTGSIYRLMSRVYDVVPVTAQEWLEPVVADEEQAALLDVEPGAALMQITRTSSSATGLPLEFAVDFYRADRTRITLQTGIGPTEEVANGSTRHGSSC